MAAVTKKVVDLHLKSGKIKMDRGRLHRHANVLKGEGGKEMFALPMEGRKNERKGTVVYGTIHLATGRIGVALEKVVECAWKFVKDIVFYTRGVKFRQLITEEWMLFPKYLGERVARIWVGEVPPETILHDKVKIEE